MWEHQEGRGKEWETEEEREAEGVAALIKQSGTKWMFSDAEKL